MDARSPDAFVDFAKSNPALAENKIIAFLSSERARADRGKISAGTINNWVKAARLFLEMSDVQLNWKKIQRVLPRARRYALDRVPTVDELRDMEEKKKDIQKDTLKPVIKVNSKLDKELQEWEVESTESG